MSQTLREPLFWRPGTLERSHLYEALKENDVLSPALHITNYQVKTPKRGQQHIEVQITALLPTNIVPKNDDVSWLIDEHNGLQQTLLFMAFKPGVLNFDNLEDEPDEIPDEPRMLQCEECGNQQADMGHNVACGVCGHTMPEEEED